MDFLRGKIYLICAFLLAGTSVISARFVTGKLGTFTITAMSLFFALLLLVPIVSKQLVQYLKHMSFRSFLLLILQSICGIFLFRVFLLNGLAHTSAGEAGILTGTTPAITALLAIFIVKEPASSGKLTGIMCTVAGILIIQGMFTKGNDFALEHFLGNMLVLCAAASESVFNTLSRIFAVKTAKEPHQTPNPVLQTVTVSAIALILCLFPMIGEEPIKKLLGIGFLEWIALLWYGVFVTALAFIFWYSGIKRCGVLTVAAFSAMMPFTSMVLSIVLLGERIDYIQCIGGLLVILGMILIGKEQEKRNEYF